MYYSYDQQQPTVVAGVVAGSFSATAASDSASYPNDDDDYDADYLLYYGLDVDGDGTLDENGKVGQFALHCVTDKDYDDALWWLDNAGLVVATELSDTLLRRFIFGAFPGGDDYAPGPGCSLTAAATAKDFTHRVGASFTGTGPSATATIPLYRYPDGTDASDLLEDTEAVATQAEGVYNALSYNEVDAKCGAWAVNDEDDVDFTGKSLGVIDFGASEKGVGHAEVSGVMTVHVKKTGAASYTISNPRMDMWVHDLYDFNYFNGFGPCCAASVQCGFAEAGSGAGVGEVFYVDVQLKKAIDANARNLAP